jgi:hypothetical protein
VRSEIRFDKRSEVKWEVNVDGVRVGATDEGEGGVEYNARATRHRALAQRSSKSSSQLRPALPRRLL